MSDETNDNGAPVDDVEVPKFKEELAGGVLTKLPAGAADAITPTLVRRRLRKGVRVQLGTVDESWGDICLTLLPTDAGHITPELRSARAAAQRKAIADFNAHGRQPGQHKLHEVGRLPDDYRRQWVWESLQPAILDGGAGTLAYLYDDEPRVVTFTEETPASEIIRHLDEMFAGDPDVDPALIDSLWKAAGLLAAIPEEEILGEAPERGYGLKRQAAHLGSVLRRLGVDT